jgi:hypothetical protein
MRKTIDGKHAIRILNTINNEKIGRTMKRAILIFPMVIILLVVVISCKEETTGSAFKSITIFYIIVQLLGKYINSLKNVKYKYYV